MDQFYLKCFPLLASSLLNRLIPLTSLNSLIPIVYCVFWVAEYSMYECIPEKINRNWVSSNQHSGDIAVHSADQASMLAHFHDLLLFSYLKFYLLILSVALKTRNQCILETMETPWSIYLPLTSIPKAF